MLGDSGLAKAEARKVRRRHTECGLGGSWG